MIQSLYELIHAYHPKNPQEVQDQKVMLAYIKQFDTILVRDNVFAHVTASPWIVNQDFTKVLMCYHNIYQSWSWCGGHVDGDLDFQHVAIKEAQEETGIQEIQLYDNEILALDILPVPPHEKHGQPISAHLHLNVTYLCVGNDQEKLRSKEDENSDVAWFTIEDVLHLVSEKDMIVVYQKLINQTKNIKNRYKDLK